MEKVGKIIFFCVLLCFFLTGCQKTPTAENNFPNLVTDVSVIYHHGNTHLNRIYTNNEKIDVILFYLYSLSPYGRAEEDPEQFSGDRCRITVTLSNGEKHVYRQFGEYYLSINNRPWQKINEDKAAVLFHLVNHIESDK